MKDVIYLCVGPTGVTRMTKRAPSLYRNEVAVRLTVLVPDAAFRNLEISATVEAPEDRVIQPVADVTVDPIPEETEK